MADASDSKSDGGNLVPVQVRPPAGRKKSIARSSGWMIERCSFFVFGKSRFGIRSCGVRPGFFCILAISSNNYYLPFVSPSLLNTVSLPYYSLRYFFKANKFKMINTAAKANNIYKLLRISAKLKPSYITPFNASAA